MERENSDLEWDLPGDFIVSVLKALSPVYMARCACIDRSWREAFKIALPEEVRKVAQGNPDRSLYNAAVEGRLDDVQIALLAGAKINFQFFCCCDAWTPLMRASMGRHVDVVRHLIEQGADVNIQDSIGYTALMWAGSLEIVRLLVGAGADVNIQDEHDMTALMNAASKAHLETVRLLLGAGASKRLKTRDGREAKNFIGVFGKKPSDLERRELETLLK